MGRADLLRLLKAVETESQSWPERVTWEHRDGAWFGYERQPESRPAASAIAAWPSSEALAPAAREHDETAPAMRHRVRLFGVLNQSRQEAPPVTEQTHEAWDPGLSQPRTPGKMPESPPLIPWPRFHPILQREMRRPRPAGIDWPALAKAIAVRQWPARPPQRLLPGWRDRLIVLLDHGPALQPYRRDMEQLRAWLLRWRGQAGLEILHLPYGPQGPWVDGLHPNPLEAPLLAPRQHFPQGAQVLLVSDLGQLAQNAGLAERWRPLLRHLRRSGCDVTSLCPMAPARMETPDRVLSGLPALCWNPGAGRKTRRFHAIATATHDPEPLQDLLSLVALFRRVDPPLLRGLRGLLPDLARDAGLEGAAWTHSNLIPSGCSRAIDPRRQSQHLAHFSQRVSPRMNDRQFQELLTLWRAHHGALDRGLEHEETLRLTAHLPAQLQALLEPDRSAAREYFARLSRARDTALRRYARDLTDFADPATLRCHSPWLGPVYRLAHGDTPNSLPEGLAHADVFPAPEGAAATIWLVQQEDALIWQAKPAQPGQSLLAGPLGNATLDLRQNDGPRRVWRLGEPQAIASLEAGPIRIESGREEWEIGKLEVPWWALEAGRDSEGAYCIAPLIFGGQTRLALPLNEKEIVRLPKLGAVSAPIRIIVGDGKDKPGGQGRVWAGPGYSLDHGLDEFGWYADLAMQFGEENITQRLRWIPPGEFLMGSPDKADKEPGSYDDEHPRHRVLLTQGYWLADTACTQGLWQAVMGNNPSDFKGDLELPVESVSWKAIQPFLEKLTALTGQQAELPSEAQWEYACRAGTATPFWWGERLTTEDANYDGNHPYNDGEKGEWRQRTLPVKMFKPNPWGLWQMHGNVWEWCRDGPRTYAEALAVDPEGPLGEGRALRGGSWIRYGGALRAAYRLAGRPGFRGYGAGFRFLLRSPSPGARRAEP